LENNPDLVEGDFRKSQKDGLGQPLSATDL
jgi:hypothetical protein